mmetsp:Transcript_1184/g.2315  ORF Transcript_1184/g.2315 Transcript_1184/m.2315 type:complete len:248 (+) Transcript_1184:61-804(+)
MPKSRRQKSGDDKSSPFSAAAAHLEPVTIAIEQSCKWKFLFFVAALCVLTAACLALVLDIFYIQFAPANFVSEVCLLAFGLLMLALDFPFLSSSSILAEVRHHIYKELLFMTRFTGRGLWYIFLGCLTWVALYDQSFGAFTSLFGALLALYSKIFGLVTALYGMYLSNKLNRVRKAIMDGKKPPKCPTHGLNKQEFGEICHSHGKVEFTDQQLGFVMSALSFEPGDGSAISPEEFNHWLEPGWMQLV